ncbi:MAG: hypothetical protein IKO78_05995 [Bacilli bacterium]|nr:hypothetical protein [Bacilli bacterium]
MDYNEYNNNGNKKKFNIDLSDKKQRARAILVAYGIVFIILIIVIRTSGIAKNVSNNRTNQNNTNTNSTTNTTLTEQNGDFAFVNNNNYEFIVTLKYNKNEFVSKCKRYGDKYEVIYSYNGIDYKYIGTLDNIHVINSTTNEYIQAELPYLVVNYYDIKVLEEIINNSTLVDDKYQITNENLAKIGNSSSKKNKEALNYITLTKKNNKIVGVELDMTNMIKSMSNISTATTVNIEYSNFGLVEDFNIEIE